MKLNYLLMGLLACGAMASCSQDEVIEGGQLPTDANGNSYISLRLVTAGGSNTRAGADTEGDGTEFDEGIAPENGVAKARFYYFKKDGSPYYSGTASNQAANYWDTDLKPDTENDLDDNIETICTPVLVVNGEKEAGLPYSIVTIINPTAQLTADATAKSLDDLKEILADYKTNLTGDNQFVMSTSVYDGGVAALHDHLATIVDGKWFKTAEDAMKIENAVDVYVERVLAKVRWANSTTTLFELYKSSTDKSALVIKGFNAVGTDGTPTGEPTAYTLKATVKGMGLAHESNQSYLMKQIDPAWNLGFTWNDPANFRSYWATSKGDDRNKYSWNNITANDGQIRAYTQEDTQAETDTEEDTEAVFVATLGYDKEGTFTPLEIAQWNFINFITEADAATDAEALMLTYIANSFYFDGVTTDEAGDTKVTAADLKFEENKSDAAKAAKKTYEVVVALQDGKTLYKDGAAITLASLNIPNAKLYKDGMTYYYTPIQHKAGFTSTDDAIETAKYGIVRNHFYDITVNSIAGLGTPIYNPETYIPTEEVEDEAAYLAAEIKVLSWRMVKQTVDLGK